MIKRKRNAVRRALAALLLVLSGLVIWTKTAERSAHIMPQVERVSIERILKSSVWDATDYRILSGQTGLSKEALFFMKEQGREKELFALQEAYFRPVRIACEQNSVLSREEYVVDESGRAVKGTKIPYVEDGDILITNCSHVLGWRNGHAGMVVDASRRLVLEAQVLGSPSVITSLDHWEEYPSFLVLRLQGADREEREKIAEYAAKNLTGIPYHLTAGFFDRGEEVPSGTHCSHLVWHVYMRFGYDLDSDGGWIVTPKDLAESELLTVIQKFGI